MLSAALHAAAITALAMVVSPPFAPPPQEQAPVELVFEQPIAPPEPAQVAAPAEPSPPPAEQPPPEVAPAPMTV